jgi:imidazoleglycerol-phosphate dehydratase
VSEERLSSTVPDRHGRAERRTRETDICIDLYLDRAGPHQIATGMPFFDHLLEAFARHGMLGLSLKASGDLDVDQHHTVEDVGIVLGRALHVALGDRSGIARFGSARVPMADALLQVDLDLSNRPYMVYQVELPRDWVGRFDAALVEDFLYAFAQNGGIDLHVQRCYGHNVHHVVEGIFKALGRALRQAAALDPRIVGQLSTKGVL